MSDTTLATTSTDTTASAAPDTSTTVDTTVQTQTTDTASAGGDLGDDGDGSVTVDAKPASWEDFLKAGEAEDRGEAPTANADTGSANTAAPDDLGVKFESDKDLTSWQKRVAKLAEKERTAYEAEIFGENGKLAWAKDVTPEDGGRAVEMYREFMADPIASISQGIASFEDPQEGLSMLTQMVTGISKVRPEMLPAVRQWAAALVDLDEATITRIHQERASGQPGSGGQPKPQGPPPSRGSVPITDENNKTIGYAYSDTEVRHIIDTLRSEMQPLQEVRQTLEQQKETARQQAARTGEMTAFDKALSDGIKELQALPGFSDHEADIKAFLGKLPSISSQNVRAALREAYMTIAAPKIKETAAQEAAAQYIKDQKRKAGAGTISPSTTGSAGVFKGGSGASWEDALRFGEASERTR